MDHKRKLISAIYIMWFVVFGLLIAILSLRILDWLVYGAACMFVVLGQSVIEYHKRGQMTWFASRRDLWVFLSGVTAAFFVVQIPMLTQDTASSMFRFLFLMIACIGLWIWIFLLGSNHMKKLIFFWRKNPSP